MVVLAVYYSGNREIARDLGDRLGGKVVLDISNLLNQTYDGLGTSAEEVAHSAPTGARQLEGLGFLRITLQRPSGLNFQSPWKLLI